MRDGHCLKCGSSDIRAITTDPLSGGVRLPISLWHSAELYYYVCVYCGYVESYVAGVQDLHRIAANYPRVEKNEQTQNEKGRDL